MRIIRSVLAATALVLPAGLPAHADPVVVRGDNTGDAGVVSVTVNEGDPVAGLVAGQCAYEQVNVPNAGTAVLVVAASAVAGPRGAVRPVATTVHCRVADVYSDVVFERTAAGESAAAADAQVPVTGSSSWAVCVEATAFYADGVVVTSGGMRCLDPA